MKRRNKQNGTRELAKLEQTSVHSMIWQPGCLWEWDLDEPAPDADGWFFCVSAGRTGSCAVSQVLSLHQDVYCGNEEDRLFTISVTLKSDRLESQDGHLRIVGTRNPFPLSPLRLRHVMEGWRRARTGARLCGDKTLRPYWDPALLDWLLAVFPNAKLLTTHRNAYDAMSSWLQHHWHVPVCADELFAAMLDEAEKRVEFADRMASLGAVPVCFEECASEDGARRQFWRALEHIGADPAETPWEDAIQHCLHGAAVGRWKSDAVLREFDSRLRRERPELRDRLLGG